ncbi:MAG: bifunctional DNA-formamidopyrimidine glycosylase/DNA-(apurinic or apyrimidinic site) lyase [bacterium]
MPELPEVETTSQMLNRFVKGRMILDVWTDYNSPYYTGKDNVKNPVYFKKFRKEVSGKKIEKVFRRAKNVLIDIEGKNTILVHMKMTGHLLYGKYKFEKKKWVPEDPKSAFADPFSRFVHLVFILDNGMHIAFSDMRKFATVTLVDDLDTHFKKIGPEPLDDSFTVEVLKERLNKQPNGAVKTVLMNHEIVAGIGNIYSDEILWTAGVHPERKVSKISDKELKDIHKWIKTILRKGIDFGGDSMSDYRNPMGEKGSFHHEHNAYRRTGQPCARKGCEGTIRRKVIGQRSAHFCDVHQK